MKRRDLLAGLVAAASVGDGQQPLPETVYIPKGQRVEDRQFLHDLMDEFAFADLITTAPTIRFTHIPTLLERNAGPYGTIYGHISKNNDQQKAFDGNSQAVVHASGKLKPISDPKALHELLANLIHKFESRYPNSKYDFSKLPDSYVFPMLRNIVGFQMKIEEIKGKYKLGQERSEIDRQSIVKHLATARHEQGMAEFTAAFYEQQKKPA